MFEYVSHILCWFKIVTVFVGLNSWIVKDFLLTSNLWRQICVYVNGRQDFRKKHLPMWLLMKTARHPITPDNKRTDSITGNLKVSRINSVTYLHDGLASFSLAALPRPPGCCFPYRPFHISAYSSLLFRCESCGMMKRHCSARSNPRWSERSRLCYYVEWQ